MIFFHAIHQKPNHLHLTARNAQTARWLAVIWAGIILVLSATPGQSLPRIDWLWQPDKWVHAGIYGILSALIWLSIASSATSPRSRWWWPIGLATLYGGLLEIGQFAFFPNRYFEVWDIVANFIGACVAAWLCERIINYN